MAAGGLDHLPGLAVALELVCGGHDCFPRLPARYYQSPHSPARYSMDQPLLERLGGCENEHRTSGSVDSLAASSGLPDDRRDRAYDL